MESLDTAISSFFMSALSGSRSKSEFALMSCTSSCVSRLVHGLLKRRSEETRV